MARLDEEILNYIRRYGPSTPVDIAQRLGANSIIVTAVLVDAVSQNKLMRSKRKTGSMKYYFYPDQLPVLQKKIADILTPQDKELLQKLMKENVVGEFEVRPEEAAVLSNLEDLVGGFVLDFRGTPLRCWYTPDMHESKAREIAMKKISARFGGGVAKGMQGSYASEAKTQDQKIIEQLQAVQKVEKAVKPIPAKIEKKRGRKRKTVEEKIKEAEAAPINDFRNIIYHWLEKNNIDIESEKILKAGKQVELEVKVPTPLGKQTYMVRILDSGKKPISQDEISSIGMEAVSRRTPVIIISMSGFAKNAKKYWEKELSDLVLLVSKDDLD